MIVIQANMPHPVTQKPGFEVIKVKAATLLQAKKRIDDAAGKFWRLFDYELGDGGVVTLNFYREMGADCFWSDHEAPVVTGELGQYNQSCWSSLAFEYRQQMRRAMGEIYVMCEDCGGKLWSVDGRPGEKTDRSIKCPRKKPNGKCGYDS